MQYHEIIQRFSVSEGQLREVPLPRGGVRMDGDALVVGDNRLRLTPEGTGRLCDLVGAPAKYLMGVNSQLRAAALGYHIDAGHLHRRPMMAIVAGDEVAAFERSDLLKLPVSQMLTVVGEGIEEASPGAVDRLQVRGFEIDGSGTLRLDVVGETVHREVAPGDVLTAGLRLTLPTLGDGATTFEAFVLRLVCSNGLTRRDCAGKGPERTRRLPVDMPGGLMMMRDQVRRLAAGTWRKLDEKLETIEQLQRQQVDVRHVLSRWLRQVRLSPDLLMERLAEAWDIEGRQATAYGALNALTRVASHDREVSARVRRLLAGLAGLLALEETHLCQRCFTLLGTGERGEAN